jgi:murein DD-endopeptidase / murein LD-carboxypeptidase
MTRIIYFLGLCFLINLSSCGIFKKKSKTPSKTQASKYSKKALLEKYSKIIGSDVENEVLYGFIEEWKGVPYKFGGKTKSGVDCSNFSCTLLRHVYSFPSSFYFPSSKLADQGKRIQRGDAREGDLVFFSINQNSKISHVGIYLANDKFVHASTSKGVIINSLEEEYYKKRYAFIVRIEK